MRKQLKVSLVVPALIAALSCVIVPILAQRQAPLSLPGDVELIRNVEYGKGGDTPLLLDVIRPKDLPEDPMPVIVFIHGGGWQSGSKERGIPLLIPFAQKGYFCATISYRLTDKAVFPAQIEDCKCAIRFLRAKAKEYNLDPDRIGVWGSSAGGHLAALLGTSEGVRMLEGKGGWAKESSRVQAVCDYFGPTDFLKLIEDARKSGVSTAELQRAPAGGAVSKLFGGPFWLKEGMCRQASPITYVTKDDPPFLIVHGDRDQVVPLSQSEVFHEALKKAGVDSTLHVIKGAGHGFPDRGETDKMVMEFFDKHMRGGGK